MKLDDLRKLDKDFLTADELEPVVGIRADRLRDAARNSPEKLGFPAICCGTRVRFPREGFIRFCEGRGNEA